MNGLSVLKHLLFPTQCFGCGSFEVKLGEHSLCSTCELSFEPIRYLLCHCCGEPMFNPQKVDSLCVRCQRQMPEFKMARAAFWHEGRVQECIHRLKYEDATHLIKPLVNLAAERFLHWFQFLKKPLLVPIPMHVTRLRERKYDQACLIAKALAEVTACELAVDVLARSVATPRQVGLNESEREKNLAAAFVVKSLPKNVPVLLIDDVFTTGATMRACAVALRNQGVHSVYTFTIARAMRFLPFAKNQVDA